ncbi:murein hydrolase activator EnvC family protein [Bacteroidota bacterium]
MKTAYMLIILILFTTLFFQPVILSSDELASKNINKRQRELEKLNKSITTTRKKIKGLSKKEKSTLKELHINQKHSHEVRRYLVLLDEQINELQQEIDKHDSLYYGLSDRLRQMIIAYAELARKTYLNGNTGDAEIILTGKSFDNDIKRDIYINSLTRHFKQETKKINLLRVAVSNETGILKDKSDYQDELRNIKTRERKHLNYSINKNKKILGKIKKDTRQLEKQLSQKKQSAGKLRKIIADLIRKEAEKSKGAVKKLSIGKISWPVNSRKIFRGYGKVKNKETNTYFDNPGIDISVNSGSIVKNIANGEVSMIHWLPGYGTLIIMNHGNGLRSVYANLSSVTVKKGDRVKKDAPIGKTGESMEGEFLHFELWHGSKRLNPNHYLR